MTVRTYLRDVWRATTRTQRCGALGPNTRLTCTRSPHADDDHHHSDGGGTITAEWGSGFEAKVRAMTAARAAAASTGERVVRLATIYLTEEEIDVLAIHLAKAVDPSVVARDAWAASRIIWQTKPSGGVVCSLSTMLAEARDSVSL